MNITFASSIETRQNAKKMKLTWKNKNKKRPLSFTNLPFEQEDEDDYHHLDNSSSSSKLSDTSCSHDEASAANLADSFREQGNNLAENGKYHEALGKWETALTLVPDRAELHEQKAQVLLEIGEAWNALKAATRATILEPSWAEGWITLGRAQLNFGEPDNAIESFDKALAIKPDSADARDDKQTALHLVKKRRQLQSSGLRATENRYMVGEKTEYTRHDTEEFIPFISNQQKQQSE
ncbi:uncharacterized protein LOC108197365 isoform X1 [Daucus carota subsp. sativus]|nr:PREDICTED: tetratricopeptide repeat protein 33 isoform X1 [Daucus carota subsp. sativus]